MLYIHLCYEIIKAQMKYIRKIKRGFKKNFDKAFYRSRGEQFVWLVSIVLFCGTILWCISRFLYNMSAWHVVELMIDPGSFAGSCNEDNRCPWMELVITLVGLVVFTSLLINAFGNWLDRRIENFKKGEVFYDFDNHILILGANNMLINILKGLLEDSDNSNRDIVILTNSDAEELRSEIKSEITPRQYKNVYVVYGLRTRKETLEILDVHETKSIYILGEMHEEAHDAMNLRCYEHLKELCEKSTNRIKCYLVLEHLSTIRHLFMTAEDYSTNKLLLTIINSLENTAQRVLVSREYRIDKIESDKLKDLNKDSYRVIKKIVGDNDKSETIIQKLYPALDRNGIDEKSEIGVHFFVIGMSHIGYAMANTAAHICHFPNFYKKGIRTKITFIQDNINQEKDFYISRYNSLFNLSYWKYINTNDEALNEEHFPDKNYIDEKEDPKGYLDIEWEFIDGGVESVPVRKYLKECAEKNGKTEYMSIAFCYDEAEKNLAASTFLPDNIYCADIPIFVYQYGGGEILYSSNESEIYKNVYPFGTKMDCYDKQYQNRLIYAIRIKYLYDKGDEFTEMPSDEELLNRWQESRKSYAFKQSNIYSANSIYTKLRSIGINIDIDKSDKIKKRTLTEDEINILSIMEHNRWNIERLLTGFRTYTLNERNTYNEKLTSSDEDTISKYKAILNNNKEKCFIHKDIAPYDELINASKKFDTYIVTNILKVINPK